MSKRKSRMNFPLDKQCKLCNKWFYSTDMRVKYCSKNCSEKAEKIKRNDYCLRKYHQNNKKYYCKQCRKLITLPKKRKFCSNRCYKQFYKSKK